MDQRYNEQKLFDIIIVGGGPSAAGLLYGILNRIISDRASSNDEGGQPSSSNLSCLRIAVLERGSAVNSNPNNSEKIQEEKKRELFEHGHASTYSLKDWFQSAHYTSSNQQQLTSEANHHPTILHTTTPQSHLSNRIIDVPTGMGWGGGTNINAGLVMQPNFEHDFVSWPGRWRGGALIKKSMEKILNAMNQNGGLTTIRDENLKHNLGSDSFVFCGPNNDCSSGRNNNEVFLKQPTLSSTANNKRVNYFTSLIAPLLKDYPELHSNVTFLPGVQVERILIDDRIRKQQCKPRACAVECDFGDYHGILRSKHDIILCSGAIGTPSLLLSSGIGTEDDLSTAEILPWYEHNKQTCNVDNYNFHRNLPVGHNLRDHILLPRTFLTLRQFNKVQSFNSILGWWMIDIPTNSSSPDAKMQIQLADGIQMDYMIPHFAVGALRREWVLPFGVHLPIYWMQSNFHQVREVFRLFFCIPIFAKWMKLRFASLNLCLLNPKSVGRVTVRTKKGNKSGIRLSDCEVKIDPNYLSDAQDVASLWRGWNFTSEMKQNLFSRGGIEILPGFLFLTGFFICNVLNSALHWMKVMLGGKLHDTYDHQVCDIAPLWFRQYAAEFSNPYYHWSGTCAMGGGEEDEDPTNAEPSNGESVVDEHLCVRGLGNLRVCDASVFPNLISAPTALTCAALGHAASSFIFE